MNGLLEFLNKHSIVEQDGRVIIGYEYTTPGYWAVLAAYCREHKISYGDLYFVNPNRKSYAGAIALEHAITGTDGYLLERKNSGKNYSELVVLDNQDYTDKATSVINSCIRDIFSENGLSEFVNDLCDVVGDLHDNVWSHGKNTGLSMAQKWNDYRDNDNQHFEFALADCGLGFLRELNRAGISANSDKEAIEWCIQEGNSSKKKKVIDDWEQRLPADITNNPMPNIGIPVMSENHHMGLGLAKLLNLVNNYKGWLWLVSGETTLIVDENGNRQFVSTTQKWEGVALACRFNTSNVKKYNKNNDEDIVSLMSLLE